MQTVDPPPPRRGTFASKRVPCASPAPLCFMNDSTGHIRYGLSGDVATLRICRPAKKNALTIAMYAQLAAALADANDDGNVRAIVIAGEGDTFTAGNDLRDFMERPPTGTDSPVFQVIRGLIYADKPLVAAVEGAAVGIGTTLLLHCDYVAASEGAVFSMPFTPLGLSAEAGSSYLLPKLCGMARAAELLLLGDRFDAAKAHEIGLVNALTPKGGAEEKALAFAEAVAKRPPGAVQATKRLMREPIRAALESVILDESTTFMQRLGSPEAMQAFEAFFTRKG